MDDTLKLRDIPLLSPAQYLHYEIKILSIYYVVILFCALHAEATNCEHTGGNNITLTFHFRACSDRFTTRKLAFRILRFRNEVAIATEKIRCHVRPQTGYCHRSVPRSATNWLLPLTGVMFGHKLVIATNRCHVRPQTVYCHRPVLRSSTIWLPVSLT